MRTTAKETLPLWVRAWWLVTGALLGLGAVSILTIGVFVLPIGIALGMAGAVVPALHNRAALVMIAGLALAVLYIAWLNKDGPGEVCNSAGTSCTDQWSPWPLVLVAILLLSTPVLATRLCRDPR